MSTAVRPLPAFEATFARDVPELTVDWRAADAPSPFLLVLTDDLAEELGLDPGWLRTDEGLGLLLGTAPPPDATPVALAYGGHQFGGWSGRLGDGRALLLGEVVDVHGRRRDLHLKGSGRTPFARRGDGKAAVGPMLREHVVGEAMHALGIPTSRALAVVATGDRVVREQVLPGAVLARVAASHVRVGTFEYAAATGGPELTRRLADHCIARHFPGAADADRPYVAFLEEVVAAQAELVARWMLVGFVHGVMNTDNAAISGETIDFGPCAFMDRYDPDTVFSSIDHGGRYRYGNQPAVAQWNLARFAESLVPHLAEDLQAAVEVAERVLGSFADVFHTTWRRGMQAKLGLDRTPDDDALITDLLAIMRAESADWTSTFRSLAAFARGEGLLPPAFADWSRRWTAALPPDRAAAAGAMDRVNPVYVPRNHLVEEALASATAGDLGPYERLVEVLTRPFEPRPGLDRYAEPAEPDPAYRTFCGT